MYKRQVVDIANEVKNEYSDDEFSEMYPDYENFNWYDAVSYTHLDVYKRQLPLSPTALPKAATTRLRYLSVMLMFTEILSVSVTDVYKRQE